MKKALITGINGFAGSHLAEHILANSLGEVHGIVRGKTADLSNIRHILKDIDVRKCDITDFFSLRRAIRETNPDYVFHLAAQSYVPESWKSPFETMQSNAVGSLNLLEAVRDATPDATVHVASSSEVYGLVHGNELPIKETNPLRPLSPYGVSKAAMDLLAYQYHMSYGMKIARTRAFNHTGPRRGEVFVTSNWAKQIVEIEKGARKPEISVGSLDSRRDFSDVRDVVRAYWLAAQKCADGDAYNICSGSSITMQELLGKMLSLAKGRAAGKIGIKTDPTRLRPSDVKNLLGDCSKIREKTGWKPEYKLETTLQDLLDYWREKI